MKLYPFQEHGVKFLMGGPLGRSAYLADVPGLGKTAQAITAAIRLGLRPFVVCPAVAVPHWHDQWKLWGGEGEIEVISYTKFARLDGYDYTKHELPELLILDEAHYAKNPQAQRTQKSLKLGQRVTRAKGRTWLLSGTPMPNNPTEFYAVFSYLWPELIPELAGSQRGWLNHFTHWYMGDYGPKVKSVKNGRVLREMLGRVMLRRNMDTVGIELPPLRVDKVLLPYDAAFSKSLAKLWHLPPDEMETSMLRRLLGAHKAPRIARELVREMLDDHAYQTVVVMYHHRDTGLLLQKAFEDARLVVHGFDGRTSQSRRAAEIMLFQQAKYRRIFLVQQQAGGIAITLTAAHEVVLVEPAWSPDENVQAIKRIHRIGQGQSCRARIYCVDRSLDEAIMDALVRKIQMRKEVIDGTL